MEEEWEEDLNGGLPFSEAMEAAIRESHLEKNRMESKMTPEELHRVKTRNCPTCRFFQKGYCRNGFKCRFSHEPQSEKEEPQTKDSHALRTAGAPMCRFFASPTGCRYGYSCVFAHGDIEDPCTSGVSHEENATNDDDTSDLKSRAEGATKSEESKSGKENKEPDLCCICMEVPKTKVGLLENCDHVFCLDCIYEWRKHDMDSAEVTKETQRKCPVCRETSNFVVPYMRPLRGKYRKAAIENFKKHCASIPCKNFDPLAGERRSCRRRRRRGRRCRNAETAHSTVNRSCKFGHFCFYGHFNADGSDAKPEQKRAYEQIQESKCRAESVQRSLLQQLRAEMPELFFLSDDDVEYGTDDDADDDVVGVISDDGDDILYEYELDSFIVIDN